MTPRIKDEFAEEELTDLDKYQGPLAFALQDKNDLEGGDWATPTEDAEEV